MPNLINLDKLPDKYYYRNEESLTEGQFIDDNALYILYFVSKGIFSHNSKSTDPQLSFLYFHPFEWTSIDFISFLISVCREYGPKIENTQTLFGAVRDEYEVSFEPRKYRGAYKWILELQEKEPKREEVVLFNKFLKNTVNVDDLERALIYADRIAPVYKDEKSELWLSKNLFRKILDYTSFSVILNSKSENKLKKDIENYINAFVQGKLIRSRKSKHIGGTSVVQSQNVFTFKKHSLLFREYLQKMYEDFGKDVIIENVFEDRFPNSEYPDAEFLRKRYAERNFYFIHILLAFAKQGLLKIVYMGSNWNFHEDEMLTYQAKIELLPAFFNEELRKKLYFDEDKARFYVQGKEIKLLKFKDEYHTLRIMFEDPKELPKECGIRL